MSSKIFHAMALSTEFTFHIKIISKGDPCPKRMNRNLTFPHCIAFTRLKFLLRIFYTIFMIFNNSLNFTDFILQSSLLLKCGKIFDCYGFVIQSFIGQVVLTHLNNYYKISTYRIFGTMQFCPQTPSSFFLYFYRNYFRFKLKSNER